MVHSDTQGTGLAPLRPHRRAYLYPVVLIPLLFIAALGIRPVNAATAPRLPSIKLTYRGGPMIEHVNVSTLFWGASWKSSSLPGYFNGFFRTLFDDGRFMANLAQYSANGYSISNGSFAATDTDTQNPPSKVTNSQIQSEIRAQVAAGHLPQPDADTEYFAFMPPGVVVYDGTGANSLEDFAAYHDYRFGSDGFAYAVIPYDDTLRDPRFMTMYASHELAEAVTDPEPYDSTVAWYDDYYGEIGDIPPTLYDASQISINGLVDQLSAADGTPYLVQKVWSLQDNSSIAFAAN